MSGERIFPMMIFAVTFLGVTLVLVGSMASLFATNAISEKIDANYDIIGGITYNMWRVNDTSSDVYASIVGHNTTEWGDWANQDLNSINAHGTPMGDYNARVNSRVHFKFYDQQANPHSRHTFEVWIVRNNTNYYQHTSEDTTNPWLLTNQYQNFVFFREYKYNGNWWGDTQNVWYGVKSFSSITAPASISEGNQSQVSFVGRLNTTIFFSPNVAGIGNLTQALNNNSGIIKVGTNVLNLDLSTGKIGALNLLADLLLFKLPEVPKLVGYIIGIPVWISISFSFVAIVTRLIPTIQGL